MPVLLVLYSIQIYPLNLNNFGFCRRGGGFTFDTLTPGKLWWSSLATFQKTRVAYCLVHEDTGFLTAPTAATKKAIHHCFHMGIAMTHHSFPSKVILWGFDLFVKIPCIYFRSKLLPLKFFKIIATIPESSISDNSSSLEFFFGVHFQILVNTG